ncbi:uncharacterized protein LOC120516762 isoform X1 [Polypterus senegalus]|uniref:uncharacterized protein LOC120516762 isoform X1 n=1 Tax=Polypterus senegalus TaxID=55291 RepID=UPI001964C501|nr:uncharacterized protein LOC120516762 isoform X1 [Polypterus senegalus]XP_039594614.1 uncharacterized protein LOC120516762 isoform X1 [Polypterus senegalus]
MEQDRNCTQLYAFIRSVFPNLNNEDLNVIVEKIQDLGVYHTEDVRYIKEEELLGVLKPVQARKLISSNLVTISDTCLASEVSVSALPASPCIIFCGDSLLTASCFMLSVDKNVVKENIPVFLEAFEMMFAAYYIFNIQYPSDVGSTLEFIQSFQKLAVLESYKSLLWCDQCRSNVQQLTTVLVVFCQHQPRKRHKSSPEQVKETVCCKPKSAHLNFCNCRF